MNPDEEKARAAIAEQASEWFVAHEEGKLDKAESAALAAWLRTSPIHVEEFLGISTIAQNLRESRCDPMYSVEAILARARAEEQSAIRSLRQGHPPDSRRLPWVMAMAAAAVVGLGLALVWSLRLAPRPQAGSREEVTALHLTTRHGEQLTYRLPDHSVLHLNTESSVILRYSATDPLVTLTSGEAAFEIVHEPGRVFRVLAGPVEVTYVGTKFDLHLGQDTTVITVIEGSVAVTPSASRAGTNSNEDQAVLRLTRLHANQQLRIFSGEGSAAAPITVDARSATAWLRREIVFDHEPLERVVAEYNRYATKQFEIETPALRNLQVSGTFSIDDSQAFIAFLRSLDRVRLEVTDKSIRVFQD